LQLSLEGGGESWVVQWLMPQVKTDCHPARLLALKLPVKTIFGKG